MTNVDVKINDKTHKMTITIDLDDKGKLSSSGKNQLVATTGGNQDIPGYSGFKLGLTVYKPVPVEDDEDEDEE